MVAALDFAREVWKVFDLNNSPNSGMEYYENDSLVKSHGSPVRKESEFRHCVTDFVVRRSGDDDRDSPSRNGKRNSRSRK